MIGEIDSIKGMAQDTMEIKILLKLPFLYKPGQYVMLSFPDAPDIKKAFSIMDYGNGMLFLGIKKHGEFTSRLFDSKKGEKLNIVGPYGRFTLPEKTLSIVFIAGGIGITPIYCMMKSACDNDYKKRIYLFYSAKNIETMALLENIKKMDDKKITKHYTFTCEEKRLDIDTVIRNVQEFNESMFYICGPVGMIDSFRKELIEKGISEDMIKSEEF